MADKLTVVWVVENPGELPIMYSPDYIYVAVTPELASMTVDQRLEVEKLLREAILLAEHTGRHCEVVHSGPAPDSLGEPWRG